MRHYLFYQGQEVHKCQIIHLLHPKFGTGRPWSREAENGGFPDHRLHLDWTQNSGSMDDEYTLEDGERFRESR